MTVSTINYTLAEEDGWLSVATNPSYIYIRCNHNSPFYIFVSPTAPSLNGAQASGTITFTGAPVADETFVVGATTYTFKADGSGAANTVAIGANVTETASNVTAAINAGAGAGTAYGVGTVANASAAASSNVGVVTVIARAAGTAGNSVVLTEAATNTAVSGSGTLTGGAAADIGALFHPHKEGVMHYEKTGSTTAQVYIRTKSPYDVVFSVIRDQ